LVGNVTWLVLGGGGLLAAFPLAYSIIMPAFYIPLIIMLLGLIFRGIAFEFRFKASAHTRKIWDYSFHFGSLIAAFCQGVILGAFVQGIRIEGRHFAGGGFDWLTPFSLMTGLALVFGYALLGATWLVMKTHQQTQIWARKCALYVLNYVVLFLGAVCLWLPFLNQQICHRWFLSAYRFYLIPIPLLTGLTIFLLFRALVKYKEVKPFWLSLVLFGWSYIGLAVSLWPWVVPYQVSLVQAAASLESQSLTLIGVLLFLPFILSYTAYCYYVFRGKSTEKAWY
jgi:cytochrome d ubiquinol oxidase subunit II